MSSERCPSRRPSSSPAAGLALEDGFLHDAHATGFPELLRHSIAETRRRPRTHRSSSCGHGSLGIGLRRLASQRIVAGPAAIEPADVVRRLGAMQAQDYSPVALGDRRHGSRYGTAAGVERAIAERQILRTWLMRGTIHFAPPEDVRWLLAPVRSAPARPPRRDAARSSGSPRPHIERCAELLSDALAGDRRLTPPRGDATVRRGGHRDAGQRGYHILVRLARSALICLGPMQGKQQTFVLLDDWAPRGAVARALPRGVAVARWRRASPPVAGPVTAQDFARWAGIPVSDAEQGLRAAAGLAARSLGRHRATGSPPSGQTRRRRPRGAGGRTCWPGSTSTSSATRIATPCSTPRMPTRSPRAPTACSGRSSWSAVRSSAPGREPRGQKLTIALQPFAREAADARRAARPEAARYRDFLGLAAGPEPVLNADP